MANKNLGKAKTEKNDEFYTQYADIQQEMNAYIEYNPDGITGTVLLSAKTNPSANFSSSAEFETTPRI